MNTQQSSDKAHALELLKHEQLKEAGELFARICNADKYDVESWFYLGCIFGMVGNPAEAEKCFRHTLYLNTQQPAAHYNLGIACRDQDKTETAVACFKKSLDQLPGQPQVLIDLGYGHLKLRQYSNAVNAFSEVTKHSPDIESAHSNLGHAQALAGDLTDAVTSYRRAIRLDPTSIPVLLQLATLLMQQGNVEDALIQYRNILRLDPNNKIFSELLAALNYSPGITLPALFTEHKRWGSLHTRRATFNRETMDKLGGEKKLCVGYISDAFYDCPIADFIEPILTHHDSDAFEIICYSNVVKPDEKTERFRMLVQEFRTVSGLSETEIGDRIMEDNIDILVDLTGHGNGNLLTVFAQKPAPLQISYLGYAYTIGLTAIDYHLTDTSINPQGENDTFYTETLLRLPGGCFSYQPPAHSPPVLHKASRRDNRNITFGSFCKLQALNSEIIAIWSTILLALPDSRMILASSALADKGTRRLIYELFEKTGITHEQLELTVLPDSREDQLEQYNHIDIILDTYPFNGLANTCDALWMGVPVITLAGEKPASRVGRSLLHSAGLDELACNDPVHYCQLASELANDETRLVKLRESLRNRISKSVLCNAGEFTRNLEQAYRNLWKKACI